MRDYVLSRAISLEEAYAPSIFRRLIRNWKARRRVASLRNFDDHMLADIGVTREDVQWAQGQPLTVNAALALEERAFKRRHDERFK
jgi:uncharacterized protein YjiS (DUF1127 family)